MKNGPEDILFENDVIRVMMDKSASPELGIFPQTNEPYSLKHYLEAADTPTLAGILGGGEQLLYCAKNPAVKEIVGIDINTNQIAFCLAKLSMSYDNERLMRTARSLWKKCHCDSDRINREMEYYRGSTMHSYGFSDTYDTLRQRFGRKDLKVTLIAGNALKILPSMDADGTTLYLSNLPDHILDTEALYSSLENFLKAGSKVLLCELSSDYYLGQTAIFADIAADRSGYRHSKIRAFVGDGMVFDEYVHVLSPHSI